MFSNSSISQTATTIVFFDASVSDYQTLQTGVVEGVETVILSPNQDGIEQISQILQQHPHITTIHIVSHGSPGCLYLGNSQLNLTNIHNYTQQLQHWQGQNILLYGCNVATGDAGEEFIRKLHEITNATISASATKTGNAALGGNWELEVNIPENHGTSLVFYAETLNTYQGVFAPTLVGEYNTSGNANGVQIVGNYAYVADDSGLQIIDISNPTTPILKGIYNTTGSNHGVQIVGNYAYVTPYSKLQIIDISNPTTPILKGTYNINGDAYGIQIVGKYAYVANGYLGLQIIDISNPTTPILKGTYYTSGQPYGVQIVGNYAYVAVSSSGLEIIDISDPTIPILKGTYDTSGTAESVQVVGNYAYVADNGSGLQIIDISNPLTPTLKGNYNTSGTATGVQVVGNYAYVADLDSGLQIIDISNLLTPTLRGNYNTSGYAWRVQVVGNYAYVADSEGGLKIIDVSDLSPANQSPTNLALSNSTIAENQAIGTAIGTFTSTDPDTGNTFTYSLVTGTGATDNSLFTITGNQLKTNAVFNYEIKNSYTIRLRTTDQGGLFFEKQLTIGVSNVNETPTNLTLFNSAVAENKAIGTVVGNFITTDLDPGNTFTYSLVTGTGATDNSLFTITGNQLKTNAVFDYQTKNSYSIRVKTTDQGGLSFEKQLTVSVTFTPTLVGEWDIVKLQYANAVTVVGNYAYAVGDTLDIIDITDRAKPFVKGSYKISNGQGVQVVGRYAYVADDSSGLQIIDISNPTTPTIKGNYDTSGNAWGVQVVGNYAYIADSGSGLQIIDISNPTTPTLKGNYDTSGNAEGVQVVGEYAYVADNEGGLKIINVSEFTNQAPTSITLSNSTVAENKAINTVVGSFTTTDPDTGDTFTYSLVTSTGATDNSLFTITGNQLKTNAVFDFETKNSYSIRVKTTDQGELSFEKQLTIGVSNVNETPTNLTLSTSTVTENKTVGTVVGNFITTDLDPGNTFTYSLVTGTGATDNSLFTITGNQLKTNAVFDFETKNSYSIRVKTTDQGGLSFEKQLTIGVSNVNETPTNLTLSNNTVAENKTVGTVIGNLTTTDPDTGNTFTYSLVTGTGATDNSLFTISGNQLKTNSVFDFETKNSYSIRVQTRDQGGLTYQKQLTINISDLTDNTITGTANTNNITTTNDKDIIDAVAGNDTITSVFTNLQQNDNINGGVGTDTLIITGGTSANSLTINANNTTNQIGNIPGTTVLGFERFDLSSFTGNVNFIGTDGNDWIKGGSGTDNFSGGKGNDSLYLGSDTAVDNVNYVLGDGTDTVYQFVRGVGGDKLNFTGIANFDVITSGTSTLVRVGDGIGGNSGFGTGQLLVTLSGTSGFTSANANLNLFGGNFLFN
jgi:hypothetical protein